MKYLYIVIKRDNEPVSVRTNEMNSSFVCFFPAIKPANVQLTVSDSNISQEGVFNLSCFTDGNPAAHSYLLFENHYPQNMPAW